MNKPLDIYDLREFAARKAWDIYRSTSDPLNIPESFYHAVEVVIRESYNNVDSMLKESIRLKLDSLYDNHE